MMIRLLVSVCLLFTVGAVAQNAKSYQVKVGEIPNKVLPREAMYTSPSFKEGTAWLRNGTSLIQLFNYNFLLGEMHFIDAAGDTLAVADPVLIKYVVIDSMVFYYEKHFVQQILKSGNYKLALRQEMVQIADKTRGAYDAASGASSIQTYGSINNSSQIYQLQVKKDVLFQKKVSYYLLDEYNHFFKADKKNFFAFFPEKNITKYQKEQKINFNKEEDLKTLLRFCTQ